jgi:hypothetical protein
MAISRGSRVKSSGGVRYFEADRSWMGPPIPPFEINGMFSMTYTFAIYF